MIFISNLDDLIIAKKNLEKVIKNMREETNFLELLEVNRLHKNNIKGEGITIGVIDSNFSDNTHGQQVVDIINQIAPKSIIKEYKYTDTDVKQVEIIIEKVKECINDKVDIINMSIGLNKTLMDLKGGYEEVLKELEKVCILAEENGIIVVCGAGNNGYHADCDTIEYPAGFNSTISIGSVNKNNEWSSYSTVNEYVDFCTYGENIELSTGEKVSGTSYSCPVASGIIALLLCQRNDLKKRDILSLLKQNALDLGTIGKDKAYGYGMIKPFEIPYDYSPIKDVFIGDPNFLKDLYKVRPLFEKGIYGAGIRLGLVGYGCSELLDFNMKEFHNFAWDCTKGEEKKVTFAYDELVANNMYSPVLSKSIGLCPETENYVLRDRSSYGGFSKQDLNDVNNWLKVNLDKVDIVLVFPYTPISILKLLSDNNIICVMCCYNNNSIMAGMKEKNTDSKYAIKVSYVNPDKTIDSSAYICDDIDCVGVAYGYDIMTSNGIKQIDPNNFKGDMWRSMAAAVQIMGVLALMKQQYPEMNNAEKVRKLLPQLCEDLGYAKNKQGYGLITAKLKSNIELD